MKYKDLYNAACLFTKESLNTIDSQNDIKQSQTDIEEPKKTWWLFTTNYLNPYKAYFSDYNEAIETLKFIIEKSRPTFKKKLRKEAEYEQQSNALKSRTNPKYKIKTSAQRHYETFKDFSKVELISSIKLLDLTDLKEKQRKAIFNSDCFKTLYKT